MSKIFIARDLSWLSFNERVLQEAMDETVPLDVRIKFLGIFSNNLDEFFRVRVAGLKRSMDFGKKVTSESFFEKPSEILQQITQKVIQQQEKFNHSWEEILSQMNDHGVELIDHKQYNEEQIKFVQNYFESQAETNVIPILLSNDRQMPYMRDKSLYIGVAMRNSKWLYEPKYAIIEVPSKVLGRFILLPSPDGKKHVTLLEDIIIHELPNIFSYFGYDKFNAHCFKVTKDAEFDLDNDIKTSLAEKIEKGLKSRREGRPTRFVFDKSMDSGLLEFLIRKLDITSKDSIIPGGKIHNFKHFMDFPDILPPECTGNRRKTIIHPLLSQDNRITEVITKKDVLLSFPYHSFISVIHLLRESAMDPQVKSIHITAYRLASESKIANALINAARNGKEVVVMLELRARFDEEANLAWKERFELEGIRVLPGIPNKKVHAKLGIIKKRVGNRTIQYGFISTGNFNEKSARLYGDYMLMTSNRVIMADINRVFNTMRKFPHQLEENLAGCRSLLVCPKFMREEFIAKIDNEIREAKAGRKAQIILKVNSLSDKEMIVKLNEAALEGVKLSIINRGIFCWYLKGKNYKNVKAISIIDEYLEHARVIYFYNKGNQDLYISSADWMTRNLDHRIEAAVKVTDKDLKSQLLTMLKFQLEDNVKARVLEGRLENMYRPINDEKEFRSQIKILAYLTDIAKNTEQI